MKFADIFTIFPGIKLKVEISEREGANKDEVDGFLNNLGIIILGIFD
jgi:hypothetical protein